MPSYHTLKHVWELASIAREMEREAVTREDWVMMNRIAAEYEALAAYMQVMTARQCRGLARKLRSEGDSEPAPPRQARAPVSGPRLSLAGLTGR
jgi:hypothetical protein